MRDGHASRRANGRKINWDHPMKGLLLAIVVAALSAQGFERPMAPMCMGAQLAVVHHTAAKLMAQERHTPPGEWCQRLTKQMPAKAHACACHEHDCHDPDPDHVSAHTDPACSNYCNVADCRCAVMDCP